ncbi:MAG: hypothetical protein EXR93_11880 [Gemmatimonadetes bacterium]|nr:hypothetical protein [Gemmatimonadota bacterium]
MPRLRLALLAGLGLAAPVSLAAQATMATERAVSGVVIDSVSGRTVRGAVLYFDGARIEHQSGRDGHFSIEHASIGDTILVVRSIGFVPATIVVPPSASATAVDIGRVVLRPVATTLDQIAVEAEAVHRYPHLEDFYRRKQLKAGGDYLTTDDIERTAVRNTSELLYRSAKLDMDCPRDPVRAGDDRCIPNDRRGLDYRSALNGPSRCEKEVFVDGRLSMQGLDAVPVEQIAGVEIYAGPATTPANFGQRRCGVIAIWTKGASRE